MIQNNEVTWARCIDPCMRYTAIHAARAKHIMVIGYIGLYEIFLNNHRQCDYFPFYCQDPKCTFSVPRYRNMCIVHVILIHMYLQTTLWELGRGGYNSSFNVWCFFFKFDYKTLLQSFTLLWIQYSHMHWPGGSFELQNKDPFGKDIHYT